MNPRLVGIVLLVQTALVPTFASMVQIPYSVGKLDQEVVISLSGAQYAPVPDTVRVGSVFSLRIHRMSNVTLAACGIPHPMGIQILFPGAVNQTTDTSAAWNSFASYPSSGLVSLDSITGWDRYGVDAQQVRAPGFPFVDAGAGTVNCNGTEYRLRPNWNRVVFFRRITSGTGIDYYAKLAIIGTADTVYGGQGSYRQQILKSITVRFVVNASSPDISGPTSIHPARPERRNARFGAGVAYELYNPLGVKLTRGAGKYEPAVLKRKAGP